MNPPKSKDEILEYVVQLLKEYPLESKSVVKDNLTKRKRFTFESIYKKYH